MIEVQTGDRFGELRIGDSENRVGDTGNYDVSGGALRVCDRGVAVGKGNNAAGRFRVDGRYLRYNTGDGADIWLT
ncbi:hypothetical protein OAS39_05855 [Pirellulales bacterium]|nr:hypothetical protein [Pirellulales bacterium]